MLSISTVFMDSVSFISLWLFISFLLPTLGIVCSFPSLLRGKINLFIWYISSALMNVFIDVNFPLGSAFVASHRFWCIRFPFSFVSRYFLISHLISSLTHCSRVYIEHSHICELSSFYSCYWVVVSFHSGQKRYKVWFQSS